MVNVPANVTVLSVFRTEIHSEHTNETTGNMINTPAMTSASYGHGRVVLNSPHSEIPPEHEPPSREPSSGPGRTRPEIYEGELAWVLRRDENTLTHLDRARGQGGTGRGRRGAAV